MMGGKISVCSRVGQGTTFEILLPPHLIDEAASRNNTAKITPSPCGRILVAEDTKDNQILAEIIIRKMGLEVVIAENGKEAVEKIKSENFDAIIMDIQMPVMNGYEATRAIRKMGVQIPVIALTAHALKGDREKCLAAGCDEYLSKPIIPQRLIDIIQQYLPMTSPRNVLL
jgi:CheY-like chemotaxis protein